MKCLIFYLKITSLTNQSGLKPGDSNINQLLPITYEIFQSFDEDLKLEVSSKKFLSL